MSKASRQTKAVVELARSHQTLANQNAALKTQLNEQRSRASAPPPAPPPPPAPAPVVEEPEPQLHEIPRETLAAEVEASFGTDRRSAQRAALTTSLLLHRRGISMFPKLGRQR